MILRKGSSPRLPGRPVFPGRCNSSSEDAWTRLLTPSPQHPFYFFSPCGNAGRRWASASKSVPGATDQLGPCLRVTGYRAGQGENPDRPVFADAAVSSRPGTDACPVNKNGGNPTDSGHCAIVPPPNPARHPPKRRFAPRISPRISPRLSPRLSPRRLALYPCRAQSFDARFPRPKPPCGWISYPPTCSMLRDGAGTLPESGWRPSPTDRYPPQKVRHAPRQFLS
jgi:hypothetical protein